MGENEGRHSAVTVDHQWQRKHECNKNNRNGLKDVGQGYATTAKRTKEGKSLLRIDVGVDIYATTDMCL